MIKKVLFITLLISLFLQMPLHARSSRNHLIKGTKNILNAIADPLHGLLFIGPKNVKKTWDYEVHGREKEEDRNQLRGKLFSIWRAPGDEFKGTIDGISNCVNNLGLGLKEYLSIFFSD